MADEIRIENLEMQSRIGITAEERAEPQRLTVSLVIEPVAGFSRLRDRIEDAVDYFQVCEALKALALRGERNLIETLAEEIATLLLRKFAIRRVEVELRKYILTDVEFVAVLCQRER